MELCGERKELSQPEDRHNKRQSLPYPVREEGDGQGGKDQEQSRRPSLHEGGNEYSARLAGGCFQMELPSV